MHLFLRTVHGELLTIVLTGVQALRTSEFMAGNIVFDVVLVPPDALTVGHIAESYLLQEGEAGSAMAQLLWKKAKERGLSALEINSSHGAGCTVLFESVEVLPNHVLV